jgi:hypothetical protein
MYLIKPMQLKPSVGCDRGTLDQEELVEMFAAKGITADLQDVDDLIRAANNTEADEDVSEMDVSFEAFSAWMQSSSPLADKMRGALGGMLEDKLDIDSMGIEERELWAKDGGWLYWGEDGGRQTVFIVLEEANSSKLAKLISELMMLMIFFSTLMFMLESVRSIQEQNPQVFVISETVCILTFTLEYLLRMWSCVARPYSERRFLPYFTSPMNIVDIVAILPFYLEILLQAGGSFGVIRVLRLARVFRVFKVGSMSDNLSLVGEGLSRSASGLTVLVYLMILFIIISASLMHMTEWDAIECVDETLNETVSPCTVGFDTIPDSTWFVLVTMTSVGYGDYSPASNWGKFVASMIMLFGILTIAIPITLIGNKFNEVWMEAKVKEGAKKARNTMRLSVKGGGSAPAVGDIGFDEVGEQFKEPLKTIGALFEPMEPGPFTRENLGILWFRGVEESSGEDIVLVRTILSDGHAALLPHFSELTHDEELHNERLQLKLINGVPIAGMPFLEVLEKVNTPNRPLALELVERYRSEVAASEEQQALDRTARAESTMWTIKALLADGLDVAEGEPSMTSLLRLMETLADDGPLGNALSTLLETAEEEKQLADENGAEELDAATLLRRAAAAEQRLEKRRQRNAAALAEMEGEDDEV